MSEKLTCPVCGTHGSDVYHAVMIEGLPCPRCGAPADVIDRVDQLRQARADEALKAELTQALTELGSITAERDRLRRIVDGIREALDSEDQP